jgi:hypothetical protein
MRIGLVDCKGKLVNLMLMKKAAFHKACGNVVMDKA